MPFATLWTVAHQASLSMRFSRQEYWSGLPCPPSGDLPDPGIKPAFLMSPALVGEFYHRVTRKALHHLLYFMVGLSCHLTRSNKEKDLIF